MTLSWYIRNSIYVSITHVHFTDGGWSAWTDWASCSVTCGVGLMKRQRQCDNPVPSGFGQSCSGNNEQTELCNPTSCHIPSKLYNSTYIILLLNMHIRGIFKVFLPNWRISVSGSTHNWNGLMCSPNLHFFTIMP